MAARHLVLYDGVCALCNGFVTFLLPRDRAARLVFASLQSRIGRVWLERFGADPDAMDTVVVIADYTTPQPRMLTRSRAVLFLAGVLPPPWRLLVALRIVPPAISDALYKVVARRRYQTFGKYDVCPLPAVEHRARFLDL